MKKQYSVFSYADTDTLMLLKREFPEIKPLWAFHLAAENGLNDTLILLKREFSEIESVENDIGIKCAAENGHNDTLMLLKKEFPGIKGTSEALYRAAGNGNIKP